MPKIFGPSRTPGRARLPHDLRDVGTDCLIERADCSSLPTPAPSFEASLEGGIDGSDDRFRVSRVGSVAKRAVAAILGGHPSKRTADKCARLSRPATLVALRIGPETYETAALPLSYVGASVIIGDDLPRRLFVLGGLDGAPKFVFAQRSNS